MESGVLADTHGLFDPEVRRLFKGVDHILHAGDIGKRSVIEQSEQIVSVTAAQSFPVGVPLIRCWSWETEDHEEQNSTRAHR